MSQQDDLHKQYKAASNEQPSKLTDQLILNAAADALKKEKPQLDTNQQPDNVVKGYFSIRRWQMPVSIAAAALITVSFVSTYNPWSVSEFSNAPVPQQTADNQGPQKKNDTETRQRAMLKKLPERKGIIAKKQKAPDITVEQPAIDRPQVIMEMEEAKASSIAELDQDYADIASIETPPIELPSIPEEHSPQTAEASSEVIREKTEFSAAPLAGKIMADAETMKTKDKLPDMEQWFEKIEQLLTKKNYVTAKTEIDSLLENYPQQSFSKTQLKRFKLIKENLVRLESEK